MKRPKSGWMPDTQCRACPFISVILSETKDLAEPWPPQPGHRSFAGPWPERSRMDQDDTLVEGVASLQVCSGEPSEEGQRWIPD
jgi:hypothetical protein